MLLPPSVFHLEAAASRDPGRFALNGVHLSRNGDGKPRACATTGKILATVGWTEPDQNEYPTVPGTEPLTAVAEYAQIIPWKECRELAKLAPKSTKPILEYVALDEVRSHGTDRAYFHTTDLDTTRRIEPRVIPGDFPAYQVARDAQKTAHVSIRLNTQLLAEACKLLDKLTNGDTDEFNSAELRVEPDRPVWLIRNGQEVQAEVAVMPLVTSRDDTSQYATARKETERECLRNAVRSLKPEERRAFLESEMKYLQDCHGDE